MLFYLFIFLCITIYLFVVLNARKRQQLEINKIDPELDAHHRMFVITFIEHYFLINIALELGVFRTFGVPRISKLLAATKEFQRHAVKRFEDTDLLLREFSENAIDSERAKTALRRVNYLHGKYNIHNDEMLYVPCTCFFK